MNQILECCGAVVDFVSRCLVASALIGIPVGVAALPFISRHERVVHTAINNVDWRLTVARDTFSGEIACVLRSRNGRAIYRAGAVGFRFARDWNVDHAIYRVDGGELRTLRDDIPDLLALGVPMDRGGMDNASAGIVWVPLARLAGASSIAIEAWRGRRPLKFRFGGLIALHDMAVERGCTPESVFVER